MKDFFKFTLASMLGTLCLCVFMGLMSFVMLLTMALASEGRPSVKDGSVLRIQLSGQINERSKSNPFAEFLGNDALASQGLDELKTAIRVAKDNDRVKGIYIEGGAFSADFATLEELRKSLVDFKKSGKFILSYADIYTQGSYYLASTADRVLLNPQGMLDWHGIASQPIFFTDLMKKVGVKMQVFKVGTFKSAVEPFILTGMSDANRQQVQSFVGDIWQGICRDVAASRKLTVDSLNAYADRYAVLAPSTSYVQMHLVDSLSYIDGVRDKLRQLAQTEKVNFVSVSDIAKLDKPNKSSDKVAVYYAEGDIVDQMSKTSQQSQIVGQTVVDDLDRLANDDKVKAVVLRINSGGGSAYASEQMWRAMQLLKKKKPVVVSMSGMAASGGYYMSCGADYIVAEPTTLTGSIGIFGMVPDASELLTEKLGLHFDVVKTNVASDFGAMGRGINPQEAEAMQAYVNNGYRLFLQRVADGRKMKPEDVDKIAQGRVWTGRQALQIRLVDKLGTLEDAIAEAARRAKVKDYSVTHSPAPSNWYDQFLASTLKKDYLEEKLHATLGEYYAPLRFVSTLSTQSCMQARMFYVPNLK